MSNEEKETKCFCQNKEFKKFIVIALGTFVGVYAALSLFAATHRPPMMPPCAGGFGMRPPMVMPCPYHHKHGHFDKQFKDKAEFQKFIKEHKGQAPFEKNINHDD